jgi:DNA-binding MarR family transcriptional regulator
LSHQGDEAARTWVRLLRAHANMTRDFNAELQAHGLTVTDFEALSRLAESETGSLRRVDLSAALRLTPSGVTRLLDGLQEAGLVCKEACSTDARVSYAHITDAGRERLASAAATHLETLEALFGERFSPEELAALCDLLGRLPGAGGEEGAACPALNAADGVAAVKEA